MKCEQCDMEFESRQKNQRFCSDECRYKWHNDRDSAIIHLSRAHGLFGSKEMKQDVHTIYTTQQYEERIKDLEQKVLDFEDRLERLFDKVMLNIKITNENFTLIREKLAEHNIHF